MNFLNNLVLWFIPVVVLAVLLLIWRTRVRRSQILKSLLGVRWNDPEHVLISPVRRSLRLWLFIAGVLLLMVAAARPYWGSQLVPYEARGRDVMVLFDVSKSMLSEDIQPSRIEHAKWLLRQLVKDSNGDRFGLVAFAGNAFLECPMTTDKTSFIQYVDELNTSSIPLGGTNLQLALETAVKAFDAAESTNRAIVLITDGDELSGDSARVLDSLKNQKIPLFIVGLGDPANPAVIPIKRGPGETTAFMRDASGNLVKTKLNEQQLVKLARETGGIYVRSTVTDPGLDQIRQRIKELIPKEQDKGIRTIPIERFHYPLLASLLFLLVWFTLSERENPADRSRKTLLLLLLPGLLIAASGVKAADNDAAAATDAVQPAAATLPADAASETPAAEEKKSSKEKPSVLSNAVKTYNEGHDLQLKKDDNAAKLYEQAINLAEKSPAVRARAYQNLGVIEHNKARQEMMQSVEQVKGQNLDGALEKLSGSEKILDKAEEMYVKSMSIKTATTDAEKNIEGTKKADVNKSAETGNVQLEQNRAEVAIDQQKLLFDRDMIAALRKKIEELKKKQEEARKKTEEARKQQQQKQDQNKQDQNKQDQNKQDQNKQDQNKQDQNKQDQNKQDQNKQDQNKQDQNKQDQNKQDQNKQDQNKQDQNKQDQNKQDNQQKQQSGNQKQNADQAMKDAQKAVDELKDQAGKLDQKEIEQKAEAARKELDKAEQAGKESKQEKADKHMKEALKYLGADDNNKNDKNDKNKNGGNDKDKKDQKDQKDKKDKKDQDKQNQQDRKLNDQQTQAKAVQQEKEIDPQQAKALLEVMAGKEKNLRDALKEQQQKMYGQIKVEKDW